VLATLDRIMSIHDWEGKFPVASVNNLPRGVSDHNTLRIVFGDKLVNKDPIFRFEKCWLDMEGFLDLVRKTWDTECLSSDPMVVWQFKIRLLRKKIKGWSRNVGLKLEGRRKI
jgi:hypothetical protein